MGLLDAVRRDLGLELWQQLLCLEVNNSREQRVYNVVWLWVGSRESRMHIGLSSLNLEVKVEAATES